MNISYSSQRSDNKLIYDFEKQEEKIKVIYQKCDYDYKNKQYEVKDEIQELFDLSSIKKGEIINNLETKKLPINPIRKAQRKEDGELYVKILNWYGIHDSLEERYPDSFSIYKKVITNGATVISDLIDQIQNLIVLLNNELEGKDMTNEKTIRSLKTSIILIQICVLETICNFFAELMLNLNNGDLKKAPEVEFPLKECDIDFLNEKYTNSNGEKKHRNVSLEEKMTEIPKIFGSLFGVEVAINKSGQEWQLFIEVLKEKRNRLVHPKFDIFKDV